MTSPRQQQDKAAIDSVSPKIPPGVVLLEQNETEMPTFVPIIEDDEQLLQRGVCRVPIPFTAEERLNWAKTYSQVTPMNMTAEGDGEYAFYRNILEEEAFPFHRVMPPSDEGGVDGERKKETWSDVARAIQAHFVPPMNETSSEQNENRVDGERHLQESATPRPQEVFRLDDAFCIHYDPLTQTDTRCAKHSDPSDVTVNLCLDMTVPQEDFNGSCSESKNGAEGRAEGSYVVFHGIDRLFGLPPPNPHNHDDDKRNKNEIADDKEQAVPRSDNDHASGLFAVRQIPGFATLHWGRHPHQTTPLLRGTRTNIILTYCYRDESMSDVSTRVCYATS